MTNYLVDPLCRGVYASSAKTLSVRSCFPQLVELESKYGSLVKGMLLDRLNKGKQGCIQDIRLTYLGGGSENGNYGLFQILFQIQKIEHTI